MEPVEWAYLIIVAVMAIYAYTQMPRAKNAKPPALQDFDVPTAQEGREVVDIMGTVWIDDPNVIWYGGLYTRPIKTKSGK